MVARGALAEAMDGGGWEYMLRRILSPGTPITEAPPILDYSIALECDDLLRVDPVEILNGGGWEYMHEQYVVVTKKEKWRVCYQCGKRKWESNESCLVCDARQILKAEKECQANQLQPEQLIVNGCPLRPDELAQLLSCFRPPQKLKPGKYWKEKNQDGLLALAPTLPGSFRPVPGKYWYDKDSRSQAYGERKEKNQNGLLALASTLLGSFRPVPVMEIPRASCNSPFSRNHEWDKALTRLACALFSLPVSPGNSNGIRDEVPYPARTVPDYLDQQRIQKLLLLGPPGAGTSTMFKQLSYDFHLLFDPLFGISCNSLSCAVLYDAFCCFYAIEESGNEYEPSEKDVIFAEDILLTRIGAEGMNDGCKWVDMFEDVRTVIFCVALSDYDQVGPHARQPCFCDTPFVLVLNKYDLFEEKVNGAPLSTCEWFADFSPVRTHHSSQSLAHQAYYYIAKKFKDLYSEHTNGKLFVWQARASDHQMVDEVFNKRARYDLPARHPALVAALGSCSAAAESRMATLAALGSSTPTN
ncbi:hypothetical protein ABZP36_021460 [Zizania latifolia]